MRRTKTLFAVVVVLMICGCSSTVDPGSEGSGLYSWTQRELRGDFSASLLDVAAATERAFVDLRLVAVTEVVDGVKGKITATLADGTSVTIKLKATDFKTTHFSIKIGAFGDKAMSQQVARYIVRELPAGG